MNTELQTVTAELIKTLNNIGSNLQNIAPEAWNVAVRQVWMNAVVNILVWSLIGLIIFIFAQLVIRPGLLLAKDHINKDDLSHYELTTAQENLSVWRTGYWLVVICSGLCILLSVWASATDLLNPQYRASMTMIQAIKCGCK